MTIPYDYTYNNVAVHGFRITGISFFFFERARGDKNPIWKFSNRILKNYAFVNFSVFFFLTTADNFRRKYNGKCNIVMRNVFFFLCIGREF